MAERGSDTTTVTVTSNTGSITVTSTPADAEIFINGIDSGFVTPYTFVGQTVGDYAVNVTLTGYFPSETQTKAVRRGAETVFDFTLTQIPSDTGSITVNSIPAGAGIFINGIDSGFVTPHTFPNQNIGDYAVNVTLAGYIPSETQTKPVAKDAETVFDFTLTQILSDTGSITVNSIPSGAGIFINGIEHRVHYTSHLPQPEYRRLCRECDPHRLFPV